MITLSVTVPEPVAAEYFEAAEKLNAQHGPLNPPIEAKTLIAFALARNEAADLCAQFDLALRAVRGIDGPTLPTPGRP